MYSGNASEVVWYPSKMDFARPPKLHTVINEMINMQDHA